MAKGEESYWNGGCLQGCDWGGEVQEQKNLLLKIIASDYCSLFMLRSLSNSSGALFKEEFQIAGAPEGNGKVLNGTISFIANKEVDLKIVLGGIEVIETMDFTSDLQLIIFKQDIFPPQTLLLEFRSNLMTWQLPQQHSILHLLYTYYSNCIAFREPNPTEREAYNKSNPKQEIKRQPFSPLCKGVRRVGRPSKQKKSIKIMQGLFDGYSLVLSLYFNSPRVENKKVHNFTVSTLLFSPSRPLIFLIFLAPSAPRVASPPY